MTTERPFSPERWDQTPVAVQDDIRGLETRVTALEAIVQRLETTVEHVTERLQHTSRPSSRPPSRDPPQATATRPRREPSGRRPGGQPGHEGHTRAVVPVDAVDGGACSIAHLLATTDSSLDLSPPVPLDRSIRFTILDLV